MTEYLTVKQVAQLAGVDESRVRVLCGQGRFEGAVKRGGAWFIPKDAAYRWMMDDRDRRRTATD